MVWYTGSLCAGAGASASASDWSTILVPLVVILFTIEHMVFGGLVMQARTQYGIPFPTMYAVPGTPRYYGDDMKPLADPEGSKGKPDLIQYDEAFAFNSVQRGHQNMIENAPFFLALLLVAWSFPLFAGIAGLLYIVGRALYMYGYMQNPGARIYGAVFIYPALLGLMGLAGTSMVHTVMGQGAY
jgi:glutathione S-transferase